MSYVRFGLMILTSTVVMFILMYLNTYAWEHLFFSETRTYMAIMMGAVMAVIMLAYMLGMYENKALNIAIFAGAVILFGVTLWLVRSQVTVSGTSYMRAMIPHHSIAVMTSERAGITDARVDKLAKEIIEAQRREIAEMRYLIGQTAAGETTESVYEDPEAQPGTLSDALSNTLTRWRNKFWNRSVAFRFTSDFAPPIRPPGNTGRACGSYSSSRIVMRMAASCASRRDVGLVCVAGAASGDEGSPSP